MQVRLRSGGSTCAWGAEASRSNKICRTGLWKNTEDVDPVPGSKRRHACLPRRHSCRRKPMIRALGIVLVYFVMLGAWVAVGLFIVIAPARFGNLVNESFGLFPEVRARDWGKKLFLRLGGLGLLGFAARLVRWIRQQFRPGGEATERGKGREPGLHRGKAIAFPRLRQNVLRLGGVRLDLLAQLIDKNRSEEHTTELQPLRQL